MFKRFHTWFPPAVVALILFVGGIASNWVAADLQDDLDSYRTLPESRAQLYDTYKGTPPSAGTSGSSGTSTSGCGWWSSPSRTTLQRIEGEADGWVGGACLAAPTIEPQN